MTTYMFNVPNNEEGELFTKLLKKFLNKESYSFRRRARGKRTESALKDGLHPRGYDSHLPVKHANRFQFYLNGPAVEKVEDIERIKLTNKYHSERIERLTKLHELATDKLIKLSHQIAKVNKFKQSLKEFLEE